jgi:hypothetical protein
LIDRRWHSSILDDRSFRGADCDSDHYLVVAKVRERLAVSKRMVKKMDMERFNLKQLNEEEVKEQYQITVKISLQLWKTYMIMGTSIGHGKLLERTSSFQPKTVSGFVNQSFINHGLMRNV